MMFATFGGGNLNKEFFFDNTRRSSGELLIGQELSHKFDHMTSITQKLNIFPNLSEGGAYRTNRYQRGDQSAEGARVVSYAERPVPQ